MRFGAINGANVVVDTKASGAEGILSLYSIDPQKLADEANAFLTANVPRVKDEN